MNSVQAYFIFLLSYFAIALVVFIILKHKNVKADDAIFYAFAWGACALIAIALIPSLINDSWR